MNNQYRHPKRAVRLLSYIGLLLGLLYTAEASAQLDAQGNAYFKNDYIQAALCPYGTYGSSSNSVMPAGYYAPANAYNNGKLGFICSPDNSWPFYYGDFMLPGAPYEGFSITYTNNLGRQQKTNDRDGGPTGGEIVPRTPNFTYNTADFTDLTWHGTVPGEFDIDCRFQLVGRRIIHTTTITNTSGQNYTNVYFARGMDPDQENGTGSSGVPPNCTLSSATYNVIQSQADGTPGKVAWVSGNGYCAPSSISLYCENPNSRVGISVPWFGILNGPERAWGATDPGDLYLAEEEYSRTEKEDWSIELAIFIGDINAGESKTITHEIRLDQPPVVKFLEPLAQTKNEGETFTYNIHREYQLDETVTVVVRLTSLVGASAADFVGVSSLPKDYTIVFGAGETDKTISVTAAYDAVTDDNEQFQLEIISVNSVVGGLATMPSKVTGTIRDVPLPVATISAVPSSVNEGASAVVTVSLSKLPIVELGAVTIDMDFTGGTATYGTDYTITAGTNMTGNRITIPIGQTTATFTLNALTDNIYEPGNETAILLMVPVSGVISTTPSTTVTIVDMNTAPVLSINTLAADEGEPLNFVLTLTGATCSQNITVQCGTADGTAVAPGDYTARPTSTITFAPGETGKPFTVMTNTDDWIEGNETMMVNIGSAVNCTLSGGGASLQATGTIVDRTPGDIVVEKYQPIGTDASESPLVHGSFRIRFKGNNVKCTKNVKAIYTLTGSAVQGAAKDYTTTNPTDATIISGSSYIDVPITVVNNNLVQGVHDVELTITSAEQLP